MKYFIYCRKSTESEDRQILSLSSQMDELRRQFPDADIEEIFEESRSAKAPGRPIFEQMLKRIKAGDAQGIVAWHPDRLARNAIDGGQIIHLLDTGHLKDLKFATYTFENTSQGKFVLQIMFGYSKYYVDSLSENIKRGNRAKIERGWFPKVPPMGYMNNRKDKTIIPDPDHFPVIKRLLEMALTASYSTKELCRITREDWHYLTPKRNRIGGKPLCMSSLYSLLKNPFFAGYFLWNSKVYKGNHEPMISLGEHERLKEIFSTKWTKRPIRNDFPYTGLIRCGECGYRVTAEHHTNRFGSKYTYYHCTRKGNSKCSQLSIEVRKLEEQVVNFLNSISLPVEFENWTVAKGLDEEQESEFNYKDSSDTLSRAISEYHRQLKTLTDLRILNHISDDEYVERKQNLEMKLGSAEERLSNLGLGVIWLEPVSILISFSKYAVSWFTNGDSDTKRIILNSVGYNLTLEDKKLSIYATKPFGVFVNYYRFPTWCSRLKEVRTLFEQKDPQTMNALKWIKELEERKGLKVPPLRKSVRILPHSDH